MRRRSSMDTTTLTPEVGELVAATHLEVIPMGSFDRAVSELPAGSTVSVTCSPTKGIGVTQECTDRLLTFGHRPIPHLAARLVEGEAHVAELAAWLRSSGLREVFVIAGDAPDPAGPYQGASDFIRDLLAAGAGVERVGVTGYPEGLPLIDADEASHHLLTKQQVLDAAGVGGWVSTQMCFDPGAITKWLAAERLKGLHLPVRLGLPGVIETRKLMAMGARLGIGPSLRYLAKNRAGVVKMLVPGGYDPTDLVASIAPDARALGIDGLHSFTFNAVEPTVAWMESLLPG